QSGQCCAVVTDSGMPVISDPGYKLVRECWAKKIEIDVIPGPSALTAAVALSGLVSSEFTFLGFIPRGKNRRRLFRKLVNHEYPIVFFESPYRITETLEDILDILGNKEIFIGRELTKIHQELIRSSVKDLIEEFKKRGKILGEITVVLK
ncbi:MAG TPA: rRNA (cytidine-2'-O-)-methyltransferase, partial [Candidatus Cloacimonetes bacterium]|nr:rRNA (cytidine-2'-O-)-methyltransferase [Candidatus Cloacimonadota bacterium]